jgi:hypothetical protein
MGLCVELVQEVQEDREAEYLHGCQVLQYRKDVQG